MIKSYKHVMNTNLSNLCYMDIQNTALKTQSNQREYQGEIT